PAVLAHDRQDTERYRDDDGNEKGHQRQRHGNDQTLADFAQNRCSTYEGITEIEAQKTADEAQELFIERQVRPDLFARGLDLRCIRAYGNERIGRITRQQAQQQKQYDRCDENRQDQYGRAAYDIGENRDYLSDVRGSAQTLMQMRQRRRKIIQAARSVEFVFSISTGGYYSAFTIS